MAFNIEPLCLECHALKDNNPNVSPWRAEETWKERKERRTRRLEDRGDLRKLEKLGVPVTFALYMKVRVEADKNPKAKFHELLVEHALSDWLDLRLKARSIQNGASPK